MLLQPLQKHSTRITCYVATLLATWFAARPMPDNLPGDTRSAGHDWWSLRPVVRPPIPGDRSTACDDAVSPIDAFIGARLSEKQLKLSPTASRETLVRRATLDLIGLPPTPEAIDDFVADESPDAFVRLIDRLLASPHYG